MREIPACVKDFCWVAAGVAPRFLGQAVPIPGDCGESIGITQIPDPEKIRELIGHQPDLGDLYVGTIHSFCYKLLQEYVPGYRGFDVLDEGKRYAFISSIRGNLNYTQLKNWLESSGAKKPYGITTQTWVLNMLIRLPMVRVNSKEYFDLQKASV